jgi:hypothetical protein
LSVVTLSDRSITQTYLLADRHLGLGAGEAFQAIRRRLRYAAAVSMLIIKRPGG